MSDSEIFVCIRCDKEHEALTQEVASYSCRNLSKTKSKLKVLDSVSIKSLTKVIGSSETQEPKINGASNGKNPPS
jgi:hypothetical protein